MTTVERPWALRVARPTPDTASVELTGVWRKEHELPDPSEVLREIQGASPVHLLTFDTSHLTDWDSWSIFLAVLIPSLPHAVTHSLVNTVGVYALIFGALVSTAAILIRHGGLRVVVPSDDQTWTTYRRRLPPTD
jgi:hypothetical protein